MAAFAVRFPQLRVGWEHFRHKTIFRRHDGSAQKASRHLIFLKRHKSYYFPKTGALLPGTPLFSYRRQSVGRPEQTIPLTAQRQLGFVLHARWLFARLLPCCSNLTDKIPLPGILSFPLGRILHNPVLLVSYVWLFLLHSVPVISCFPSDYPFESSCAFPLLL